MLFVVRRVSTVSSCWCCTATADATGGDDEISAESERGWQKTEWGKEVGSRAGSRGRRRRGWFRHDGDGECVRINRGKPSTAGKGRAKLPGNWSCVFR